MASNGRRTFLGMCLGGLAAAAAAVTAWPVYRYLAPRPVTATAAKADIPAKDVPEGEAKFFDLGGATAVLVRKRGGDLIALSAVCTHLGCIVQWEKDQQNFLCPCHGGHYTAEGDVTAGPPPKSLTKLPVTVANGIITVG